MERRSAEIVWPTLYTRAEEDRAGYRSCRGTSTSSCLPPAESERASSAGQRSFRWPTPIVRFHFHGEETSGLPHRYAGQRFRPDIPSPLPNIRYASRRGRRPASCPNEIHLVLPPSIRQNRERCPCHIHRHRLALHLPSRPGLSSKACRSRENSRCESNKTHSLRDRRCPASQAAQPDEPSAECDRSLEQEIPAFLWQARRDPQEKPSHTSRYSR